MIAPPNKLSVFEEGLVQPKSHKGNATQKKKTKEHATAHGSQVTMPALHRYMQRWQRYGI